MRFKSKTLIMTQIAITLFGILSCARIGNIAGERELERLQVVDKYTAPMGNIGTSYSLEGRSAVPGAQAYFLTFGVYVVMEQFRSI